MVVQRQWCFVVVEHGGDNGERGAPLEGTRAREGEEVSERDVDGHVVVIMRLSPARLVGPVLAYGR